MNSHQPVEINRKGDRDFAQIQPKVSYTLKRQVSYKTRHLSKNSFYKLKQFRALGNLAR